MALRFCLLLACLPLPTWAGVCATNGTDEVLLFVAQAAGAAQVSQVLTRGQTLCSKSGTAAGGVVRVFTDAQAIEGCSRLVAGKAHDTLLMYQDFDRCHWASHDD